MKIAMILDSEFPPDPRVENEALTLIDSGHKVYLFCITYHDNEGSEEYKGIRVNRVKVPKMVRSISALAYTLPLYHYILKKVFSRVLNIDEFDAIHIHDIQSARTFFQFFENKKIMRVLDLHENRPEIMKYYEHVNSFLGKVLINPTTWKKFEEKYIAQADKVIVVTESAKEYYKSIYNEDEGKFAVVPNSVNRSFIDDHDNDNDIDNEFIEKYKDKFVILYLGNTGKRRGIGEVLEAINILKQDIPELKFLCIGSSKSDTKWQEMISKLNIEKYVDLLGWQDFEKFPTFLKASDIGISPLHKNIHHDTTYANKLFQYMSFQLPVIVSNCDAQEDVVIKSKCGMVFKQKNVDELVEKIRFLYKNEAARKTMGLNGYNAINEKYLWKLVSKELIALYK